MNLFRRLVLIFTVPLLLFSCKDWWPYNRDAVKKAPKGTIYQNLVAKGNFSLFLQAIDITGYKVAVNESELLTVFAPTNEAFSAFLESTLEVSSLDEVRGNQEKLDMLERIVAYHIVQFSYNKDDFLSFTTSADFEAPRGDGSAHRYKTLMRDPITYYKDPINRRDVQIYSREKYLQVMSTNLFKSRRSPNYEEDYRYFYPNVNWKGDIDQLYVGEAAVLEMGIPTDNGYLYTIDKVVVPPKTIYQLISDGGPLNEKYSYVAHMLQRFNTYDYSKSLSDSYALPGDSLFLHYTFRKPQNTAELPEIGSDWTYHDEMGAGVIRSMSWAVTAMLPTNDALETWVREKLPQWADDGNTMTQIINDLPYNTLYHILVAHVFDKRNLVIPSQLPVEGLVGICNERFTVDPAELDTVVVASNGVIYGMNQVNEPALFRTVMKPLFEEKTERSYQFFANAFNQRSNYFLVSDLGGDVKYTLFVISDEDMGENYNQYVREDPGSQTGKLETVTTSSRNELSEGDKINLVVNNLVYGYVPVPEQFENEEESQFLRYYITENEGDKVQFIYCYNGEFYDELDNPLGYQKVGDEGSIGVYFNEDYGIENGIVYQISTKSKVRDANASVIFDNGGRTKYNISKFVQLMADCGIVNGNGVIQNSWNRNKELMFFAPNDDAVEAAELAGFIPFFDPNDDTMAPEEQMKRKEALRKWCLFYTYDRFANGFNSYALPGLDPLGLSGWDDAYEREFITGYDPENPADFTRAFVGWAPDDFMRMYMKDNVGNTAYAVTEYRHLNSEGEYEFTKAFPLLRAGNTAAIVIDRCFDYNNMYGN